MIRSIFLIFCLVLTISVFANGKEVEVRDYPVFSEYPGISEQELLESSLGQWEGFNFSTGEGESYFEGQLVFEMNLRASEIWNQLVSLECYGSDIKKLRSDYLDGQLICFQNEVRRLKRDFRNWLTTASSGKISTLYYWRLQDEIDWPAFHPLFGQILMEAFAYQREKIEVSQKLHESWEIGYLSKRWEYKKNCLDVDEPHRSWKKTCELAGPLYMLVNLSAAGSPYCQSFGFWPNASQFLFLYESSFHTVNRRHPNEEMVVQYDKLEFGGQVWSYEIIERKEVAVVSVPQEYHLGFEAQKALEEDYSSRWESKKMILMSQSCWSGKEKLEQAIDEAMEDSKRRNPIPIWSNDLIRKNPTALRFVGFYADLFEK